MTTKVDLQSEDYCQSASVFKVDDDTCDIHVAEGSIFGNILVSREMAGKLAEVLKHYSETGEFVRKVTPEEIRKQLKGSYVQVYKSEIQNLLRILENLGYIWVGGKYPTEYDPFSEYSDSPAIKLYFSISHSIDCISWSSLSGQIDSRYDYYRKPFDSLMETLKELEK